MPPKRGRTAKGASKQTATQSKARTPRAPRRRAPSDREILEAFRIYAVPRDHDDDDGGAADDDDEDGVLLVKDVRRCLKALELPPPPADFFEPGTTALTSSDVLALAHTLQTYAADDDQEADYDERDEGGLDPQVAEIDAAFSLFARGGAGRITLADLRRTARELREEVDDKVLRMMIEEANGEDGGASVGKGVGREEFEAVMRRAGVF